MNEAPRIQADRRLMRPKPRSATIILPQTGERIKKAFTLRNSIHRAEASSEFLLAPNHHHDPSRYQEVGSWDRVKAYCTDSCWKAYRYVTSTVGVGIFKCSLAYVLGSCATLVPAVAGLLGRNDGKHVVATIIVYFHPARSVGSMLEAICLAFAAFLYASCISFSSMAVSVYFGKRHLLAFGHALVLIVFCGGGLGLVGWTKQKLSNPLVNVACSLTSLALITVLTREGAVQAAMFSYQKVWQVLRMVIMACTASAAICLLIRPMSARHGFRDACIQCTDAMAVMLNHITQSFLSGDQQDLKSDIFMKASSQSRSWVKSLVKNLGEAKFEHYALGTEEEYEISSRLVTCLEKLMQSIGGLQSAAETQFALLSQSASCGISSKNAAGDDTINSLQDLPDALDGSAVLDNDSFTAVGSSQGRDTSNTDADIAQPELTPADMFSVFIVHLGPPMKSLAYTLCEVLSELPFGPKPHYQMVTNEYFRPSLVDAKALFANARRKALAAVYRSKVSTGISSAIIAADFEEVASSCGYFSSSLQDFAEDMVTFLDILEDLKACVERRPRKRTYKWLKFWRSSPRERRRNDVPDDAYLAHDTETHPSPHLHQVHNPVGPNSIRDRLCKPDNEQPLSRRIWIALAIFRRDDFKYAVKVGIGAVLYAMWSFIQSTREVYSRWRGEWGLLSYMLVCSMTIGASNTTGFQRFAGTCLGAVFAVAAWIIADERAIILGFLGWLVSLFCFYIIVGKGRGPMGRFILLTYNLSALYAYSLSAQDDDDDDDEGGVSPEIWEIVLHRVVAVMIGCLWGIIVTRVIWPISARSKLKNGLSLLWFKMGLIWKRGPLKTLLTLDQADIAQPKSYMTESEELELRHFLSYLETLHTAASSEFRLKGPFPDVGFQSILRATSRMLDSFHAMNVIIWKDSKATEGEMEVLKYTSKEWTELSRRISHIFSVMASSLKLEYPLNDVLPEIEHTRDRLLAKVFEFRKTELGQTITNDEDYELLYTYALVTGQLGDGLGVIGLEIEKLYGVLDEENLILQ